MRKTLTLIFTVVFALLNAGMLLSQNKEDGKFDKALENYFDALWKFYPTSGTMAGFHKYDNKLEDLSKKNIEKRHEELDSLNQEFVAKVDKMALSPEKQFDHEMVVDGLDLELIKHEMLLPWSYNPMFYNDILNNAVRSLFDGSMDEAKAKGVAERLKNLPKLIKQAKENLETPPEIYTQTAIAQFTGILNFYKNELPGLIEQAPASQKTKMQENLNKALPELDAYSAYLTNELLPKSTGNFRLAGAHNRLMRIKFQNDIPVTDLNARTKADINNIRREMFLVCIPFYRVMFPEINLEQLTTQRGEEQVKNIVIKGVLDKIKGEHVTKEELFEKIKATQQEIKSFIQDKQLIDLPETDLEITDMPLDVQGITWTRLIKPALYDTGENYSLQIAPINGDLNDEQIQSMMEEYNNYFLPFYTIRKIYPGQYVPYFFTMKHANMLTKMFPNMPLIKAWPIFIEEMVILNGMGNYDLRARLNQLKFRLKAVIDFTLDLNVHQGGMTKDQAMRVMTITGFQSEAEAERNWNRIILNPIDAAYAYVGLQELLDMEKAYKQKMGASFNQKEFLAKVLSYGPIPIRHLKNKINE